MKNDIIQLSHGAGGRQTQRLVSRIFAAAFENPCLDVLNDASVLPWEQDRLVMTTDTYVVTPLFFPGGDIGRLAVCGTVNDLAVMGAMPVYISTGFILEEGFAIADLEKIASSMRQAADEAGAVIVTGDTKVVPKHKGDGVFINTAGIGRLVSEQTISAEQIRPGDAVILTGSVGNHGLAVISARGEFGLKGPLRSDVAPLSGMVQDLLRAGIRIHAMRDATRGGVATVLNELAETAGVSITVNESAVPLSEAVHSACTILGFDPLYVANEGLLVIVLPAGETENALQILRGHKYGSEAVHAGEVHQEANHCVYLKTAIGSRRMLNMRSGEQLPRIC
ncbi:hydrogenase expression/formation protein HypE [bacterium]|nr:hydrogenase expression/formation protein HypE [bacterium]